MALSESASWEPSAMRIAVFQGPQESGDVAQNLERLERAATAAAPAPGC